MIALSTQEEIKLLKDFVKTNPDFLDNGSSRAVFAYEEGKVIKIAFDEQGCAQNINEVMLFQEQGDKHLATIYAYGKYVIIMEEVEPQIIDMAYSLLTPKGISQVEQVLEVLEETFGYTDDNNQIGWSSQKQRYVAYDYGFNTYKDKNSMVSREVEDYICEYGHIDYIQEAIRQIELRNGEKI